MIASRVWAAGFIATVSASLHGEADIFAALLKRQEPGSPAYNCHDNCGTAITLSKAGGNVCNDDVFLFDYKNCLQCAGPDNFNIWRHYGRTLSSVAGGCGLDTEPTSGKQEDVPEAKHPSEGSGSAAPTPTPTAASVTTAEGESTSESAPTMTEGSSSGGDSTTAAGAPESTMEMVPTGTHTVSSSPSAPTNGTGSFTSAAPPEFTGVAAALQLSNAAAVVGFAVLGAAFGLGN